MGEKKVYPCTEIATLVLVELFWCLLISYEVLMSGIILFGAWKGLRHLYSTDEKVMVVKPEFGCL